MIRATFGLWLIVASASIASAATIQLISPDQGQGPSFSLYIADDPQGVPVATGAAGTVWTVPAGTYVYGVESFQWRSQVLDAIDEQPLEVALGGLQLTAPDGAQGRFGLFDASDGRLVRSLDLSDEGQSDPTYIPEGSYLLRRDLSTTTTPISVSKGTISILEMGSLIMEGPAIPDGQRVFVASETGEEITATIAPLEDQIALPSGTYQIASETSGAPVVFAVEAGQSTRLKTAVIDWVDRANAPTEMALTWENGSVQLPKGGSHSLLLFDTAEITVARAGDQPAAVLPLASETHTALWRMADGRIPQIDGLDLFIRDTDPQMVFPGANLSLATRVAAPVDLTLSLRQIDRDLDLGVHKVEPRQPYIHITIPSDISSDQPVLFHVTEVVASGANALLGQSTDYPVHRSLVQPVANLSVDKNSSTLIGLTWEGSNEPSVVGYAVFRDGADRPINGRRPVKATQFVDLGLSANRLHTYKVCPVDGFNILGPCTEIAAETGPKAN